MAWISSGAQDEMSVTSWVLYLCSLMLLLVLDIEVLVLVYNRTWPPIKAARIQFYLALTLGLHSWALGWALKFIPVIINWRCMSSAAIGLGMYCILSVQLVRRYRTYMVMVRHRRTMWPVSRQLAALILANCWPILIDIVWAKYDPVTQDCIWTTATAPLKYFIGYLAIAAAFAVYAWRCRRIRSQVNESSYDKVYVITGAILLVIFPVANALYFRGVPGMHELIFFELLGGVLVAGLPQPTALVYHWYRWRFHGDNSFLHRWTFGLSDLPSADILVQDLGQQLNHPVMLQHCRRILGNHMTTELVNFIELVNERELCKNYFERRAVASEIIDRFIKPGAPELINISSKMQQDILGTDINHPDLFDKAKHEVIQLVKSNFSDALNNSAESKELHGRILREEKEIQMMIGEFIDSDTPYKSVRSASDRSLST